MDLNLLLSVAAILVSTFVAYHIAVRQGAFNRARAQLRFGFVPTGDRPESQPWVVLIGFREQGSRIYAMEIPIALTLRGAALKNVWLQTAYPKGRHGTDLVGLSLNRGFSGESFRAVHSGPFTFAECSIPVVNQDGGVVVGDLVGWRAEDLQSAALQVGEDKNANARLKEFRWSADRITLSMRAENHPAMSVSCWLVAFTYKDRASLDDTVALIAEAVMRRDGIPIKSRPPGSRVFFSRRHVRTGLLVMPEFKKQKDGIAIDHLSDGERQTQFVELTPVGNSLAPRIIDQVPNEPPAADAKKRRG